MGNAIQDEWLRGLPEPNLLVEAAGILLGFNVYALRPKAFLRRLDPFKHHSLAIAFTSLHRDHTSYGHLFHMRPCRADAA